MPRKRKARKRLLSALPGPPFWGGSARILRKEVRPVVRKHGIAKTSSKRWATYGNPSSDHYRGNLTAFADDYATANNHALADEIGRELGIGNVGDYENNYITRRGRRYRVQIIAGTHGTGPHLHVGVRRA